MPRTPFVLGSVHYDLGHLAPLVLLCPQPASMAVAGEALLRIEVAFSHHCYTVGTTDDPSAAGTYHVAERGDVRLFNAVRWELCAADRQGGAHVGAAKLPLRPPHTSARWLGIPNVLQLAAIRRP